MDRMRIVPRGDRLQLALQLKQRGDPLQRQRLVSVLRALVPRDDGEAACDGVARTALSVLF